MARLDSLRAWFDAHREVAFDLLRIYLGLGLIARGVLFIADAANYTEMIGATSAFSSTALMHYVALAHLGGGVLLTLGLLTRIAALVQVPILVGAVFLVHLQEGLLTTGQSLEFSALVLVMLVLFTIFGAGPWSLDAYLFRREEAEETYAVAERPVRRSRLRRRSDKAPVRRLDEAEPQPAGPPMCPCGHTGDHPKVIAEPRYGLGGTLFFVFGVDGPPKEVVFRCSDCGEIIDRTRDPKVLRQHYGRAVES